MKKYIAEFIGTFTLIFSGTGAVIVNQYSNGALGLIGIAITFGIVITAMIYTFGAISGTHINPAVTLALALDKKITKKDTFYYLIAQITGAILASLLLNLLFPKSTTLGATSPSGTIIQSFILEFVLTYFLMLIILGVSSQKENANISGIIIGATVTAFILLAGPISGGSFNPARSIAPALVSGKLTNVWIYITAPILGTVLGLFSFKILSCKF